MNKLADAIQKIEWYIDEGEATGPECGEYNQGLTDGKIKGLKLALEILKEKLQGGVGEDKNETRT